jgi:single-strand DNA-binding protein
MKSVNKVILIGNLTRDPELRHTAETKKAVCTFGLATNRMVISESGEKQEEPEFHRIVAWDKLAEVCNQYLKKGRKVYVEGRLQYRTYTGQDGIEKFSAEIVLEDMAMLDSNMPKGVKDALDFHNTQQA